MHWSAMLVLAAGTAVGGTGTPTATKAPAFESYTEAYHAASDVKRPMLVVLNPAEETANGRKPISLDDLRRDPQVSNLLDDYVVAVIDTGTEHGKKVHELFGAGKALPRVVVIDDEQEQQIFRTSSPLANTQMRTILQRYRSGSAPVATNIAPNWTQSLAPGNCPNCRRF